MTRIIRSDFEGVVHAHLHDGTLNAVVLKAGDVVPDGVLVGDHLLDLDVDLDGVDAESAAGASPDPAGAGDSADHADDDESVDDEEMVDEDGDDAAAGLTEGAAADVDTEDLDGDEDVKAEAEPADEDEDTEGLDAPRGNASTEAWADYADALGVEFEPEASRTEIQAAIAASKTQG